METSLTKMKELLLLKMKIKSFFIFIISITSTSSQFVLAENNAIGNNGNIINKNEGTIVINNTYLPNDEKNKKDNDKPNKEDLIQIKFESMNAGDDFFVLAKKNASIKWLIDSAIKEAGLLENLNTGGYLEFSIRWVMVDQRADNHWRSLNKHEKENIEVLIMEEEGIPEIKEDKVQIIEDDSKKISDLKIKSDTTFHLYAIPNYKNDIIFHQYGGSSPACSEQIVGDLIYRGCR